MTIYIIFSVERHWCHILFNSWDKIDIYTSPFHSTKTINVYLLFEYKYQRWNCNFPWKHILGVYLSWAGAGAGMAKTGRGGDTKSVFMFSIYFDADLKSGNWIRHILPGGIDLLDTDLSDYTIQLKISKCQIYQ